MNFTRIYAVFVRQLFLLKDNSLRFVNIFVWGIIEVIIWGFLTRYLDTTGAFHVSFTPLLLGAVILWAFLSRVQQGMVLAFFEDVWSRNFLNLFGSPLTVREYLCGIILTAVGTSIAGLAIFSVLALAFFGYNVFSLGAALIPLLLILFEFGIALGIFSAAIGLRFGPSAEWIAWVIPSLTLPLAGVYYPVSSLPQFLQAVSKLLPPSYAFEAMRALLERGVFSFQDALAGIGLGLLYLTVMYWFFMSVFRRAIKHGLIARFSAEEVSY